MLETALLAFTTFFATIGPLDTAALFPPSRPTTRPASGAAWRPRAAAIGGGILAVLRPVRRRGARCVRHHPARPADRRRRPAAADRHRPGVRPPLGRHHGHRRRAAEATTKHDVSVFPLATPLIAGPGAIGAAILLVADAQRDPVRIAIVRRGPARRRAADLSPPARRDPGAAPARRHRACTWSSRVLGVLLAALAVQFLFDGIRESGIWR